LQPLTAGFNEWFCRENSLIGLWKNVFELVDLLTLRQLMCHNRSGKVDSFCKFMYIGLAAREEIAKNWSPHDSFFNQNNLLSI
jgi:hypothetical protein